MAGTVVSTIVTVMPWQKKRKEMVADVDTNVSPRRKKDAAAAAAAAADDGGDHGSQQHAVPPHYFHRFESYPWRTSCCD